jgi:hypothetical protein
MRSMNTLGAAASLVILTAALADAQPARPFRDSWFWGIQTGVMGYNRVDTGDPALPVIRSFAPTVGLDWLITRTRGGLFVSYSQAFLSTQSLILNGPTSADTGLRIVDIRNVRRFNMVAMAFPGDFLRWHPYVGAGFSFRYLASADAQGPFTQQRQFDYASSAVNQFKAALGPAFMGGAQFRLKRLSAFGQVTLSAGERSFLLANGHSLSLASEFGVRYNVGSSIDR